MGQMAEVHRDVSALKGKLALVDAGMFLSGLRDRRAYNRVGTLAHRSHCVAGFTRIADGPQLENARGLWCIR